MNRTEDLNMEELVMTETIGIADLCRSKIQSLIEMKRQFTIE